MKGGPTMLNGVPRPTSHVTRGNRVEGLSAALCCADSSKSESGAHLAQPTKEGVKKSMAEKAS